MSRITARFAALSLVGAVSLSLAACAPAPASSGDAAASDYCARMVTNSGGLEDRSFNQTSWAGMEQAKTELGIDTQVLVSTSETDLAPNVAQAVDSGCKFILTVGYELASATEEEAKKNPDIHFAIVDETVAADNVKPIIFDTAQASFLAGYLAAGATKTGVVATFGGGNQPPVTLFMDGFVEGVKKYNEVHKTSVKALGWDVDAQDGLFTGDFEDTAKGKTLTQGLIDQGADIILPVAGQVGEGAAAAALEAGNVSIIWVDNDGWETLPTEYRPIVMTSVMKNTQSAVLEVIETDKAGSFSNEPYVGRLDNGGVDLAPYHDWSEKLPKELQDEVQGIRDDIVSGVITITSPSTP